MSSKIASKTTVLSSTVASSSTARHAVNCNISLPIDITALTINIESLLALELARQTQIDNVLPTDIDLTIEQLFQRMLTTTLFAYCGQLLEYVYIRSHLYDVDSSTMIVRRRHDDYRHAMQRLFAFIDNDNHTSVSKLYDHMRYEVDNRLSIDARTTFDQFLVSHQTILELTEEYRDERYVSIRGTYDTIRNVLLPRFYR